MCWQHKRKSRYYLIVIAINLLMIVTKSVSAHSPHDVIDALALSPNFYQDQVLFVAMSASLRKSNNGGYAWQGIGNGLDNKFLFTDIAVSPSYSADGTLFVSSDGDGIYKSVNEGRSWRKVNEGLGDSNISKLKISPNYKNDKTLIAVNKQGALFLSRDGADTWKSVFNDKEKISALAYFTYRGQLRVLAGDTEGNIYLSEDAGSKWRLIDESGLAGAITAIAVSPNITVDGTLFVGTKESSIFKSIDAGNTFKISSQGLSASGPVIEIGVSPDYVNDRKVVVSTWFAAGLMSVDGGQSWSKHDQGLTTDSQADKKKYLSSHFRDVYFSNEFSKDKVVFVGGYDGLFKSYDGGLSWQQLETMPVSIIKAVGVGGMGDGRTAVGVGTYGGGGYVTQDDGKSWIISNVGLRKTRLSDFAFSPKFASDETAFAGASGMLLKSVNGGKSWHRNELERSPWRKRLSGKLSYLGFDYLSQMVLPLSKRKSPYPTKIVLSPDFPSDKTVFFGTREHGIFKSEDGGQNSARIWDGHDKVIAEMVISSDYDADDTLYVCVRGEGIYKSEDGGNSFKPANKGLDVIGEWKGEILHGAKTNDLILAISPEFAHDKTVFAASSHGLYKSEDGGKQWLKVDDSVYGHESYVIAIAVSPEYRNDKTILISVKGKGLFKSKDGGNSFSEWSTALIDDNHQVNSIIFSPYFAQDKKIYSASYQDLFVSYDGGVNWDILKRPVRYENHREVVSYIGDWKLKNNENYSATKVSFSDSAGSEVKLSFVGTGVKWIGTRSDSQGIARVYIDGDYMGDVDQFGSSQETLVETYDVGGLTSGPHSIRIEVAGEKGLNSKGQRIEVDAFDILP